MFIMYPLLQVSHPLLEQSYYLDEYHKARLKEEFGKYHISSFLLVLSLPLRNDCNAYSVSSDVEPWSFDQCVGEAVIIPAGCPYQNRKNKVLLFSTPQHALNFFIISNSLLN